jgi:predicted Zn-dependent protease
LYRLIFLLMAQVLWVAAAQAADFRLLVLDKHFVKWGAPAWGSGAEVTYAFVREEMRFDDAINCKSLVPLKDLRQRSSLASEAFEAAIEAGFRQWSSVVDLEFVESEDPDTADILIGAQGQPRGIAYTNLWHSPEDGKAISPISRASICFNPVQQWQLDPDGDRRTYEVTRVMAHEIGHAIGLNHSGPSGQLMAFRYSEAADGLGAGDVAGAVTLYGAPPRAGTK